LAVVAKSNAYGCGLDIITQACQEIAEVDWLAVNGTTEALRARQLGFTKKILVLCFYGWEVADLKLAITQKIDFTVYSLEQLVLLNKLALELNQLVYIHIKIDTGLARLGFTPAQAQNILLAPDFASKYSQIKLWGIFTHLAEAEKKDSEFSARQIQQLQDLVLNLRANNQPIELVHAVGSTGMFLIAQARFDLVRIGGMAYGLSKLPNPNLQFVLQWKTRIIQIKELVAGVPVGYNQTFMTQRPTKLAVLPVGYCDGYSRKLSNLGQVSVNNVIVPVIGRVAMNMITIDITDVPEVLVGAEATLLGAQAGISPYDWSDQAGIYIYESIVGLNPNIARKLV
jgi:alanine racemase